MVREREQEEDTRILSNVILDVFTHMMLGHTVAAYKMDGTGEPFKFVCGTSGQKGDGAACDFKRILFLSDLPTAMKLRMNEQLHQMPH